MNPSKTMSNPPPPITKTFDLYRCYWIEATGIKKGYVKGPHGANNEMHRRLAEGLPAWVESVPNDELDDDDIPF